MPWPTVSALPDDVKNALPEPAQEIWRKAANAALETYNGDESKAAAIAWDAVKKAGYRKVGENWVKATDASSDSIDWAALAAALGVSYMADAPATTSREGVELVRTGTWAASTGITTIRPEDLADMVKAAYDPEIDEAYVKIGHVDPRFDGEPALGWVRNLRVKDGTTLVGDLVDIPSKLAEVIPVAFKRRSVEIAWGVRTPSGKRYRAALTGLALLGVQAPAVKGLADVLAMYGDQAPPTTTLEVDPASDTDKDHALADRVSALSVAENVSAEDEQARLEAEAAIRRLGKSRNAGDETVQALLSNLERLGNPSDGGEPGENGENRTDQEGVEAMDKERLKQLLAEADLDAVDDVVKGLRAEKGETPTETTETKTETTETKTETPAETTPPGDGTAPASQPEAETKVPELAALSQAVASLTDQVKAVADDKRRGEIDQVLQSALSAGKIAPVDVVGDKEKGKVGWRERLESDFEGTKGLLDSLTPAFPTSELGAGNALETTIDEAAWAEFERETFGIDAGGK